MNETIDPNEERKFLGTIINSMKNKKRVVSLKGYIGIWKKSVREEMLIKRDKDLPIICESDSVETKKQKYTTVDCPVYYTKQDAKRMCNSKDWEIKEVIVLFKD